MEGVVPGRLVDLPGGDPVPPLARYLRHAADTGHWVLLVTARTPGQVLLERLPTLGVDLDRVVIIDVVTRALQDSPDPERLQYVQSPNLLELLTLRGEKVVWKRRRERTRIATFDLNSFARANPPDVLEQMVRYVLGRVRDYTFVDYFVDPDRPLPPHLLSAMQRLCESEVSLEAAIQVEP